jgi:hypothetical protein
MAKRPDEPVAAVVAGQGPAAPEAEELLAPPLAPPLAQIEAEHRRARQIGTMITTLASGPGLDRRAAQMVLRFLHENLSDHMRDETEDIYPLLLRRCPPDYDLRQTYLRIKADQDKAAGLLPMVRAALARCLDEGTGPTPPEARMLLRFVALTRRHMQAETAILLPLARAHLTRRDLAGLTRRMRQRRGLPPLTEERPHAD